MTFAPPNDDEIGDNLTPDMRLLLWKSRSLGHRFYSRDDGLRHCKICGGAEASLPNQCPGRRMNEVEESQVQAGRLDFVDGSWRLGTQSAQETFCEQAWAAKCAELSESANRGCGLVYEVHEARLGASIDAALQQVPESLRQRAIEIAVQHGYTTAAQREETERMLLESGACSHGFDPYHFPVGCGDVHDKDVAEEPSGDYGEPSCK